MFVVVEFAIFQLLQREFPRLGGVGFGLVELLRCQRAPPEPGVRFDHFRRDAVRLAVGLDVLLRERKVAARDGGPHVGNYGGGRRRQLREEHKRDLQRVHVEAIFFKSSLVYAMLTSRSSRSRAAASSLGTRGGAGRGVPF